VWTENATISGVPPATPEARLHWVEDTLPHRLRAVARSYSDQIAVFSPNASLTYHELVLAADRTALALLSSGVSPGDRVGILAAHDVPLIAALCGVLHAGAVAVVLSEDHPAERLQLVVREAGIHRVVADAGHREMAQRITGNDPVGIAIPGDNPGPVPEPSTKPDDLAFLIQTSGSTGRPKLVMQTHRNILHNAARLGVGMELTSHDRMMLLASPNGGQGLATLFSALLHGAALGMFPVATRGVLGLSSWMQASGITVYVSSASLFRHFCRTLEPRTVFEKVRLVRVASEPATGSDFESFRAHFPSGCILFSTLSSSETGNVSQARLSWNEAVGPGRLTVGTAAEGMEIELWDAADRPVGTGVTGRIMVRSRFLSPGYWGDADRTRERFRDDAGFRIYQSGDMGWWREDGKLMFAGRGDSQVKIRGYRIEISEIEEVLGREPMVSEAAVGIRENERGEPRLVAYVVTRTGVHGTAPLFRTVLRRSLPGYMVPAVFIFADTLPRNAHGKIDRNALATWPLPAGAGTGTAALEPGTQRDLAAIWEEVFETTGIGPDDDFFDLGGDSLTAAVLGAKIHDRWSVDIHLETLTARPRLEDLARAIDLLAADRIEDSGGPRPVPRDGPLPLSFIEEWCLDQCRHPDGAGGYHVAAWHRLAGPLDPDLFRRSLDAMVARHEMLRTTFRIDPPGHIIHPPRAADLEYLDFTTRHDPLGEAAALFRSVAKKRLDPSVLPLFKFWLVRIGPDEYRLIRLNHHIVSDGWSWKILFRELAACYEALLQGLPDPCDATPRLQYVDYAAWQRASLQPGSPAFQATHQWWREMFINPPPPLEFPFRRFRRKPKADPSEGLVRWGLEPEISEALDLLARSANTTYFATRLAGLTAWMSHIFRTDDLVLGTYLTTRERVDLQEMFGFFTNIAPLRFRTDPSVSFGTWLRQVRDTILAVQSHSRIPYNLFVDRRGPHHIPMPGLRVIASVSNHHVAARFGGVELTWLDREMEAMPRVMNVRFDPFDETRNCRLTFDARVHDPARVRMFTDGLERFFREASLDPAARLDVLWSRTGGNRTVAARLRDLWRVWRPRALS
jgi:amino acid adenylation domain-containing protein